MRVQLSPLFSGAETRVDGFTVRSKDKVGLSTFLYWCFLLTPGLLMNRSGVFFLLRLFYMNNFRGLRRCSGFYKKVILKGHVLKV